MSKIETKKVVCVCCKNEVEIKKILSFSSDKMSLDGNLYNSLQYVMQECPICHYISMDISDTSLRVSRGMLNAFRMKSHYGRVNDSLFINLLKAAEIYERNKCYYKQSYLIRLASFHAKEMGENNIARNLLRDSNAILEKHFEELDTMSLEDIGNAVVLIDIYRQLGILQNATDMCDDLLELIQEFDGSEEVDHIRNILNYEKKLVSERDLNEHFISEAF